MRNSANSVLKKDQPKEIFGWVMYDWANSVFFTSVLGVLVGEYITSLAQASVGENGVVIHAFGLDLVTARSVFSYTVGLSVFLQVFFLPVMGAIADYTRLKKTFMAIFCVIGVIGCALLSTIGQDTFVLGCLYFLLANLGAGASIVFYNSFLNDITTDEKRDKVSSWGFAAGYISGGGVLLGNLILLQKAESFGMTVDQAVRFSFLFAAIWWAFFSLFTFILVKSRDASRSVPEGSNYVKAGFAELADNFRTLIKLKGTLVFLLAYLLYNDGIQTVISSASIFLSQELFVSRGIETDRTVLFISFLIAQFVAFFGSLIFERIANFTSSKTAILVSLVVWSGIVIYAYTSLENVNQAYIMSGFIGLVLGGSQAISRSLFSKMIPAGKESGFFGIYEISERGTSWIGPIVFGLVAQLTDSYRPAILALIAFFILGFIVLATVNTNKAIIEASEYRSN